MGRNRLLVVNAAALSCDLARRGDLTPHLSDLIAEGSFAPLRPVFPAVTIPVQASLTTGAYPDEHGMVANGVMDRDLWETHFWHQPDDQLRVPRFWSALRRRQNLTVAMLFWQTSKYADVDWLVTPAPIHAGVETIPVLYTHPLSLEPALVERFGTFPLHHYWGPMANLASTQWIARCTAYILETFTPDLTLTYLPHLDYNTQRFGPRSSHVLQDLAALDSLIGELRAAARSVGARMIVLSEYGMSDVTASIDINRALREADLLEVRTVRHQDGRLRDYVEIGGSRAFAMVDHQIAHIFCREGVVGDVSALMRSLGCETLAAPEEKRRYRVDHPRCGEIIAIAPPDRWFNYHWWNDPEKAPPFARTVDIHAKPGYDPLDLYLDPSAKGISFDTRLIRGSHGRLPASEGEQGVFISSEPLSDRQIGSPISAIEVPRLLRTSLGVY